MKICYIADSLPEYHHIWGGAEVACYKLTQAFVKEGADISVLTNKTIKQPREDFKIICVEGKDRLFRFDYYNPSLVKEVIDILKALKPHVVHLHKFDTFSVSIIPHIKKLGLPIAVSIYDYRLICPNALLLKEDGKPCRLFHGLRCVRCLRRAYNYDYPYLFALQRVLFRRYLKLVDRFIVLSRNSSEILQAYGIDKDRISVIPLPLYESDDRCQDIQEKLIVFMGWLCPHKGLHIVINALPQIIKAFPEAQLWIAETGKLDSYLEMIKGLIDKFNLNSNIKFLGKLPHAEAIALLKKAHIVVVPEQWENVTPVILGEAASLGKPVVASRIGGIPEFVEIKEFLAVADDPNDFADKIIWILNNKDKASTLAESMRQKSSEVLRPSVIFKKLTTLYAELIGKGR